MSAIAYIDLLLPATRLRGNAGDGSAMARDDDGFATFDLVEQLGKVGLGLGGLNFACNDPTVEWSKRLVYTKPV